MSSGGAGLVDLVEVNKSHVPQLTAVDSEEGTSFDEKQVAVDGEAVSVSDSDISYEDLKSLRRVAGKIPWTSYTIAFVEFCERFSYYGTTTVFVNFIQRPLPDGSTTGAGHEGQSGALDMGQRASTGLTTFNSFWSYIMPLLGAYIADQYLGRFKTIQWSIAVALVGHTVLIISAIPPVIQHPSGAIACFSIGLVIMGVGTGGFKSNISPLIAEQYTETKMKVTTTKKGERVITDPTATYARIFMWFYFMINCGSLVGQIGMVYAEKYVGFWLSYLLPTIMFCLCPMVLYACKKHYTLKKPTGSVLAKAVKLWSLAMKPCWSWNPATTIRNARSPEFWQRVKPSHMQTKPEWMTFDDAWVDEVRRGFKACTVFLWYPVFWLAYNQMNNNLTSQAATMELHGVPNDLINNLNPLSLIIFIPICDRFIYPALRKAHIRFTPLKRITGGFFMGVCAMTCACVTQVYIYRMSPCGNQANDCETPAPINVWVQTLPYVFIAFGEIFASITGLEYAFTKAPRNMRSLVTAVYLFMTALSSAVGQALVALSEDPLLVWNYGVVAVLAFIAGFAFWFTHRKQDAMEDELNMLPESDFTGRDVADEEK
ncbi:MFS peptide transporter [Aulographum hederae CBS 113979]|uniref:MFS peptide transporter n=1 Tax=Aulographum hederae CBS 113979 TaxID=1176131 RepID=A0A6G1GJ19_9PEZI|nr:MFS peptide transporter [Aulographum hederae CBS 113979]